MTAQQAAPTQLGTGLQRRRIWPVRWQDLSLYTRVVAVNTSILLFAALVLVLTPVTVSFPLAAEQGLVLGLGLLLTVLANAVILRRSFRGLAELVQRMETLDVVQPRERLQVVGGGETRALIAGFNTMLERLEVERRISTRRALWALENERKRISQELHDEIGQRLTGTLLQLSGILLDAPPALQERLVVLQDRERSTLDEVGALAWQLRPGSLDHLGLLSALGALVESFTPYHKISVTAELPSELPPMTSEQELVVYRIAQEALTNAARHAEATDVHLRISVDTNELTLLVVDNGRGLPPRHVEGAGMRGMRERSFLVGGELQISSAAGGGVTVQFRLSDPGRTR
jgi:two-component system, NarL family, sensor histidine kinase UhpB